jgi:hypothetical protein
MILRLAFDRPAIFPSDYSAPPSIADNAANRAMLRPMGDVLKLIWWVIRFPGN